MESYLGFKNLQSELDLVQYSPRKTQNTFPDASLFPQKIQEGLKKNADTSRHTRTPCWRLGEGPEPIFFGKKSTILLKKKENTPNTQHKCFKKIQFRLYKATDSMDNFTTYNSYTHNSVFNPVITPTHFNTSPTLGHTPS